MNSFSEMLKEIADGYGLREVNPGVSRKIAIVSDITHDGRISAEIFPSEIIEPLAHLNDSENEQRVFSISDNIMKIAERHGFDAMQCFGIDTFCISVAQRKDKTLKYYQALVEDVAQKFMDVPLVGEAIFSICKEIKTYDYWESGVVLYPYVMFSRVAGVETGEAEEYLVSQIRAIEKYVVEKGYNVDVTNGNRDGTGHNLIIITKI